ncbi:MAG: hypothetical protein ACK5G0_04030 [Bacteroidota bacterium]
MKFIKIFSIWLFFSTIFSGCNAIIDFVAPGFALMAIIGAILMFLFFLIGSVAGLLTTDKNGKSNFEPEGLFVAIIFGVFLFGIFGDGCN